MGYPASLMFTHRCHRGEVGQNVKVGKMVLVTRQGTGRRAMLGLLHIVRTVQVGGG